MSSKTAGLSEDLRQYMQDIAVTETEAMKELRNKNLDIPWGGMQICPEQGQFMKFLIKLLNVKQVIEIGVFTGYSSLCMASSLPLDGKIIACDVSEEWTSIAKEFWQKDQVAHKVDLRIGPATETMQQLIDDGLSGQFDLTFIDADKVSTQKYYELSLNLLKENGVILIDNIFMGGGVLKDEKSEGAQAMRAFSETLKMDPRVDISLIPIGDGLMMIRKK